MNTNIYTEIVARAIKNIGSKATQARGMVASLRKNPSALAAARKQIEESTIPFHKTLLDKLPIGAKVRLEAGTQNCEGYLFSPIINSDARERAAASIGNCGQRTNVSTGSPQVYGKAHQARREKIHYKGRYRGYSGWFLYQDYQSCVGISRSGRSAVIIRECVLVRRIIAPAGMLFRNDSNGFFLQRVTDKMDYHLTPEDWDAKNFATRVRTAMSKNYLARQAEKRSAKVAAKDAKEASRIEAIKAREIGATRVTLDDSRRAGNCVEGSLRYAETRLQIDRETIINNGYLFSVRASRLLATNGDTGVKRAVNAAWLRETTVTI